jgi:hypothetical protein
LGTDNKRAPHELDDEDDGESHAADEPTAVWDESALRAAGLTDLLKRRESEPPPPPSAAVRAAADPSIVIDQGLASAPNAPAPNRVSPSAPDPSDGGGLGWAATIGIAVAVGAVVYLLIRLIKG